MPKVTKKLGNNKARAWESLGFAHKKKLCQHFDTTSKEYFVQSRYYILEGTSIPSKLIPKRTTLATLADKAIRNIFTASFSSRRIL